ncbi:MAG: hypothetical protein JXA67_06980, partial [Micromonosporaceae bacterium]|nr:hypothetical protein [Micromonosporaceae bacterium]
MTRTRPLAASSLAALIVLLWPIAPTPAYAGETGEVELTVFAGSDKAGDSYRNGVPATQSTIDYPSAVAVAPDGTVYIAETTAIRAVSPSGMITTVAGTGSLASWTKDSSPIVNNQPATSVALQNPRSLSVGADGTVYIADELSRVLRLSPDGRISTLAGTGTKGYSGDGGPAQQAMLSGGPELSGAPSVAAAPDGTV